MNVHEDYPIDTTHWKGVRYATVADFNQGEWPGWVKVPEDAPAYRIGARWYVRAMVGSVVGRVSEGMHTVTEHEDGTITIEPSLVFANGWHGWLRNGVFEALDLGQATTTSESGLNPLPVTQHRLKSARNSDKETSRGVL